jgi:hypothetical protein
MLVLFDQGTPVPIRPFLIGHTVKTAAEQGWNTLSNGNLLNAAEAAGFDLQGRKIAIVVLGNQQWPVLRVHVRAVVNAVNAALPGSYVLVEIPAKKR